MKKVHLIREQRYTISAMHRQGCTPKMTAQTIEKDKSVVSHKLKRNVNPKGKYSFEYAQDMAEIRKERMKKQRKLMPQLKKTVISMIEQDYSPQQITGKLKIEKKPSVSHETIYKIIRKDKEAGGTLYRHTRHRLNIESGRWAKKYR